MSKVLDIFRHLNFFDSDVGLEIEAESNFTTFPRNGQIPRCWIATEDGSLRGESVEYVLGQPVKIDEVDVVLDRLEKKLEKFGTKIDYSFRCGVHVHVNCQDLTLQQVINFAAIYYIVENLLMDWCGEDRVGNQHCLRAIDAEYVIDYVTECFRNRHFRELNNDNIRYAGLNFVALPKYGSLEFRGMGTEPTFDRIRVWTKLLHRLKFKSKEFADSKDILYEFSHKEGREFVRDLVGEDFFKEIENNPQFEEHIISGMRISQDLIYFSGVEDE